MKWKNPDTIRVYEHYFDEENIENHMIKCLKTCKNEIEYEQSKR